MTVNSIGFGNYYAPAKNPGLYQLTPEQQEILKKYKARINPHKDKVFIDSRTGELTTWKPGLYDPKQNDTKKAVEKATKIAGVITAGVLAFIFRGKIKKGAAGLLEKAKPLAQKVFGKTVKTLKTVAEKVTPYAKKGIAFIKDIFKNTKPVS